MLLALRHALASLRSEAEENLCLPVHVLDDVLIREISFFICGRIRGWLDKNNCVIRNVKRTN